MKKKVAINGFGRIGRSFLRSVLEEPHAVDLIDVVAINVGPCLFENIGHLFKYDSVMGVYQGEVCFADNTLHVDDVSIPVISEVQPECTRWSDYGAEWIIEATGCFTQRDKAAGHLKAGARKVLITAPGKDEDVTIIPGINDGDFDYKKHDIISLGSCTTNAFAPVIKVLHETFGIANGIMVTTHAYTNNQVLLDSEHKDPRRARAAAINIIPTSTGAAQSILKIFPELTGRICAQAIRVPVPKVSLLDFTFIPEKDIKVDTINAAFHQAALNELRDVIAYTDEPLVSSDFSNTPYAAIIDSSLTCVIGAMGKVSAWYDNEYGYACRVRDFLLGN